LKIITNMTKNTIISLIAVAIIFGGGGFYGGMKYGQNKGTFSAQNIQNMTPEQRQQMFASRGGNTASSGGNRMFVANGTGGGGMTSGEIISKDDKSVTVKLTDGGSKIVLLSGSTSINKAAQGTPEDLTVGQQITAMSSSNSDGSVTANTIQIRPNTPPPAPTNN
jgi:hypothetical protein